MAKSILETLTEMLDADGQAYLKYQMEQHPELVEQAKLQSEVYSIYTDPALQAPTQQTTQVAAPVVPVVPNTQTQQTQQTQQPPAATVTAPAAATADLTRLITDLSTKIDARLADLDKRYIPTEKLSEYRTEMLASSIKAADDYATVRESHRAEFNEPLDRAAFEKFVADQSAAGAKFVSMQAAHDQFVAEKRVKAQIEKGVAEGVKQKTSAMNVPGQTQSVAMSAAQQVLAKAKQANAGEGSNAAQVAAQRLADLVRARDNAGAVN